MRDKQVWWLGDYERRARLIPGLWLVAPIVVVVLMFGLRSSPLVSAVAGLLTVAGAPVVLASLVRDRGLRIEGSLYEEWGGKPTTQLLTQGPPSLLAERRASVEAVTSKTLPSVSAPDDDLYDTAVRIVQSKTRDRTRFELLFEENRNYGYERNMLGAQPTGRVLSLAVLIGAVPASILVAVHRGHFSFELGGGLAVLSLLTLFWWRVPSNRRTRTVAFKYAERLVDAAMQLAQVHTTDESA